MVAPLEVLDHPRPARAQIWSKRHTQMADPRHWRSYAYGEGVALLRGAHNLTDGKPTCAGVSVSLPHTDDRMRTTRFTPGRISTLVISGRRGRRLAVVGGVTAASLFRCRSPETPHGAAADCSLRARRPSTGSKTAMSRSSRGASHRGECSAKSRLRIFKDSTHLSQKERYFFDTPWSVHQKAMDRGGRPSGRGGAGLGRDVDRPGPGRRSTSRRCQRSDLCTRGLQPPASLFVR